MSSHIFGIGVSVCVTHRPRKGDTGAQVDLAALLLLILVNADKFKFGLVFFKNSAQKEATSHDIKTHKTTHSLKGTRSGKVGQDPKPIWEVG